MANIIDYTYFIGPLSLPVDSIQDQLSWLILRFEPEILTKILGYDLKKAFVSGIAEITPLQKWTDLLEGKEYQDSEGLYRKWVGFQNTEKISVIANYIFFKFYNDNSLNQSTYGMRAINSENGQQADMRGKLVNVYNEMVVMISEMNDFIIRMNEIDSSTYPNYYPEEIGKINKYNF